MPTYEHLLRLPESLDPKRVVLIDGHSLAYRSFYALPDLTTSDGRPINAIYGFWRAFVRTLREYPSAYVSVAFDAGGKTFRHELFDQYKANRKPMPDELRSQIPIIIELLEALGVPVFSLEGVEADDVLASIAGQSASKDYRCLIASSDKDLAQMVDDHIALLRAGGRGLDAAQQVMDPFGVEAKYGVSPSQIVDLLSMVGDTSDNVPGVPGVGQKTATRLLQEYGTLDEILASAPARLGKTKVAANLEAHAEDARRARALIQLKTDLDVGAVPEVCKLQGADLGKLSALLTNLEFTSALEELALDATDSSEESVLRDDRSPDYHCILSEEALNQLMTELERAEMLSLDLETTSTNPHEAEIVGIALSTEPWVGYYIPIHHDTLDAPAQLPLEHVLERLRPYIESETPQLIGQNLKYDLIILTRYGLAPRGIAFDSMIASHLVDPEARRHNLESIAQRILHVDVTSYSDVAGKDGAFSSVPIEEATQYAAEDAEIVQRLLSPLQRQLTGQSLTELFETVELPLVPVLVRMERNGILLDTDALAAQGREIRKELEIVESDLYDIAGEKFNPASPKQVGEILFHRLGLPVVDRTKTGPSTSAKVLETLALHHPLPGKLLTYRELTKLLNTYIDQLPKTVHPDTGRIHSSFHQAATATGRLSSSDPNLQNIPTRTEIGGRIRGAFIAPPDHLLVAADYSQIELRLLAHFSADAQLIEGFETGLDLHRLTAGLVFDLPEDKVTDAMRDAAKRINFGILYGISPYGLARELGISQAEARDYIERFFAAYPKTKEALEQMVDTAAKHGYAETLLGRRRPLPNLTSRNRAQRNFDRRNAVNTPIQGSAADLIKLAMIRIDAELQQHPELGKLLLQIHDELVFETPVNQVESLIQVVRREMEQVMPLRVPLVTKVTQGRDWGAL